MTATAVHDATRQAEQIVIGAAMTTVEHADELLTLVAVDQLGTPAHRAVWRAIARLRERGEPTDPAAVANALLTADELHKVGGAVYLADCLEAVPVAAQGPHYAGIVAEAAHQRGTQLAAELTRRAGDTADPIARRALLDQARAAMDALEAGGAAQPPSHLERLRAALLDSAGLDSIPDPEPLIGEDILFRDSLVWVVGKPGHGKSFVVLDMAAAVGSGEPWQTYPVQPGPVLFLVAEGARGTKKRVRAWEKAMGRKMTNVYFLPLPVQSTNRAEWDALVELCRELQVAMIVIDTQARVTVGVEENSNTEMGHFVDQAEKLRAASAACVVIVHHIGRNGETGRGATVLDGALSTIIKVSKDEHRIKLECTKNKDDAEWDDILLRAVPAGEGKARSIVLMLDTGQPAGVGGHEVTSAAMRTARAWWETHADIWVGKTDLVDVIAPKSTFHRHNTELRKAGLAEMDTKAKYPRYRLTGPPAGAS
ncbi:hypothetical protein FHG89_25680 [Micromonospora orduensis]|uniref:DNA helicase DnaB-like N-terminal domain-containing protein n=1 Tax=Micromonospora orduensis TaxID=1420891 RepID=A0A5C4QH15_9ACTN|nr:AAA family ATPase [Micromonospora orduensis]TNH24069.1 hypothetical protein FHG89_25680 [Micromonospora orduensis]